MNHWAFKWIVRLQFNHRFHNEIEKWLEFPFNNNLSSVVRFFFGNHVKEFVCFVKNLKRFDVIYICIQNSFDVHSIVCFVTVVVFVGFISFSRWIYFYYLTKFVSFMFVICFPCTFIHLGFTHGFQWNFTTWFSHKAYFSELFI